MGQGRWSAVLSIAVAVVLSIAWTLGSERARAQDGGDVLADLARQIGSSEARADETLIGGVVSEVGHWTFVNRAGERLTASGPLEVDRVLKLLGGTEAPGAPAARIGLLTTAASLVRGRAAFGWLPRDAVWRVLVAGRVHPVVKGSDPRDPAAAARVEVRPGVTVDVGDEASLEEACWHLLRPIRRDEMRLVALEPGGARSFGSRAAVDQPSGRLVPDRIDPAALAEALAGARGQTVVVSGRLDGDRLIAASGSALGADSTVDIEPLRRAAAAGDVDLLVLRTANARQPGSRNWLWLEVGIPGLATALERPTLADILAAIGASNGTRVRAVRLDDQRTRLEASPAPASRLRQSVDDVLAPAMTEVTGDLAFVGLEGQVRSAARRRELDWRLVPWVSAIGQSAYLALIVVGVAGLPIAHRWFARLWPAENRREYAGPVGYGAARVVRGLVFVLLALPLLALPAVVARAAKLILHRRPAGVA